MSFIVKFILEFVADVVVKVVLWEWCDESGVVEVLW